jgi:poly-gamma-glutamate capsule biosynthesis protein CapA/YwtB (metallophosphatase superfamily)
MSRARTTVALTGNTFIANPVQRLRDPRFLRTIEYLRSADVTLTNLECSIPDPGTPPAFAAGSGAGATYMVGTAAMVDDLKFMGVDGVCAANNHVSDFGDAGILSTMRVLRDKGLPFAGIGASLTEASQAAFVTAPTGLRIAFLVACDWGPRGAQGLNFPWPHGYLPSDDGPPFTPRPGVNLLRYQSVSQVSADQLEQLRRISADLGWEQDKVYRRHGVWRSHPMVGPDTNLGVEQDTDTSVWFLGRKFEAAGRPGQYSVPCQADLDRLYRHIRDARRQADIVCVGLHDQSHAEHPQGYIDVFAHGAIDAGADVYFNNGGTLGGIEIYKGRPILYGLPSLFLQTEAVVNAPASAMARYGLPADATGSDFLDVRASGLARAMAEAGTAHLVAQSTNGSAIHSCVFDENGALTEVRFQPIEPLGGGVYETGGSSGAGGPVRVPRFRKGLPLFPDPGSPVAAAILERARTAAAARGTELDVRDGVGTVHLS